MKIYVLHGFTDGLIDPIVSTDYEEVYTAMKTAYESSLDGVEQDDSDREYSFWKAGPLLRLYMATGWNGRLQNWS